MIPAFDDARRDPALVGPPLAVYLHLLHDVLDPVAFRPVKQLALAAETKFSLRTIESVMALLLERRYLEREEGHSNAPRRYRLVYSRLARAAVDSTTNPRGTAA